MMAQRSETISRYSTVPRSHDSCLNVPVLFSAPSPGQDLTHQVTAEWKPLQMPPLHKDQELGDWHCLQRRTPPQLQQGKAYGNLSN